MDLTKSLLVLLLVFINLSLLDLANAFHAKLLRKTNFLGGFKATEVRGSGLDEDLVKN